MSNKLRILSFAVAMFGVVGSVSAEVVPSKGAGLGSYSTGYRMGLLTKCSVKGMISKSLECQLTMGRDSSIVQKTVGDVTVTFNPWAFSGSPEAYNIVNKYVGKYVYIKYEQAQVQAVTRDTDYNILEITDVTKKEPACSYKEPETGNKSEGNRVGRIVKVSNKGTLAKTTEVIIQVGNSGNEFIEMSIVSGKVNLPRLKSRGL